LASIISSAEDFFDSPSDKEAVLKQIQENPDEVLMFGSSFKKKIAHAMIAIASLTKEVDEIAEAIADKKLTPAQVKVQITKALADQRTFLETTMEERMATLKTQSFLDKQKHFERDFELRWSERARWSTKMEEQMATERARTDQLLDEQKRHFEQQLSTMKDQMATEKARTQSLLDKQKHFELDCELRWSERAKWSTKMEEKMATEKARTDQLLDEQKRQFERLTTIMNERLTEEKARTQSLLDEQKHHFERRWCQQFDKLVYIEKKQIEFFLWQRQDIMYFAKLFKIDTQQPNGLGKNTIDLRKEIIQRFLTIGPVEWERIENDIQKYVGQNDIKLP